MRMCVFFFLILIRSSFSFHVFLTETESPLNGQPTQIKRRRPLDDLSVSVAGDSKKNRSEQVETGSDDSLPCEVAINEICEDAARAQENQQPSATTVTPLSGTQLTNVGVPASMTPSPLMTAILPSLGQTLPSLSSNLPTPPAAHQQVAQTLPDDMIIPSPPARRRSLLMWNPRLRGRNLQFDQLTNK